MRIIIVDWVKVWESCKWISESNTQIASVYKLVVWESCKWISESNCES